MAIIDCIECGKAFSDKAPACPHCGCPIEFAVPQLNAKVLSPKETPPDDSNLFLLRDYLEKIRLLELDIYTMNQLIPKLQQKIKDHSSIEEIKPPGMPYKRSPPVLCLDYIPDVDERFKEDYRRMIGNGANPLWALKEAVFMRKQTRNSNTWTINNNEKRKAKYEEELKEYTEKYLPQYEKEMAEYERQMAEYELRIKTAHTQIELYNIGIKNQVAILLAEKSQTEQALQTLYDANIIFPKYRGIIPVTMFCEYIDSGRRTRLGGVRGMYDLYEEELLGKRIVESIQKVNQSLEGVIYQLSGIAGQLTGIARNQILLHEEVAKGNAISEKISMDTSTLLENSVSMLAATGKIHEKINDIHQTAKATERNTAATAYGVEVASRRVDAIAKIEEYKYALSNPMFPSI